MTEKDWKIVGGCVLFRDISPDEVKRLCTCLGCCKEVCEKGVSLLRQGEPTDRAGLLLSGRVLAESVDEHGERSVHAVLSAGQVFGDALVSAGSMESPVTVSVLQPGSVLWIPGERIMDGCEKHCTAHVQLRRNLQREIAEKYWALNRRISYLTAGSLRTKLTEYLRDLRRGSTDGKQGTVEVTVPYSREQLAAYLGVNRSAMCRELSAMRREGLVDFQKNRFVLSERL